MLFACSLLGAVHIELLTDQTTEGFIQCLKRFVARKRGPQRIYSENVKTFEAAAKWLKKVMNSEKFYEYFISKEIKSNSILAEDRGGVDSMKELLGY